MSKGKIYQSLSGFYDVYDYKNKKIYRTRGRGNFRKKKIVPLVGDKVEFESSSLKEGYLLSIFPRKNYLIRPPVSNTDQAILVTSVLSPNFSANLLDRQLISLENKNIKPIIYFTKVDLLTPEEFKKFEKIAKSYQKIGYIVILPKKAFSLKSIDMIKNLLPKKQSMVMGQTGAGKSTLLNHLSDKLHLATGSISRSLNRGKHTTRKVSLLEINKGLVADTPGFSSYDILDIRKEKLKNFFPEFVKLSYNCRFGSRCLHINEPGCAVKNGNILKSRYDDYIQFFNMIKNKKPNYNKKRGYAK